MSRTAVSPPLVLILLILSTPLVVSLFVPSLPPLHAINQANWDAAIRKGTLLFQQLQSGCYPDTQNPIDREGLEAIGFTIHAEDQTNDWPPTFVKRSAMETKEVKMFKWTETEDAYWRARVDRECMALFTSILTPSVHRFQVPSMHVCLLLYVIECRFMLR